MPSCLLAGVDEGSVGRPAARHLGKMPSGADGGENESWRLDWRTQVRKEAKEMGWSG